jgi:Domain of unknown function (DUF4388)
VSAGTPALEGDLARFFATDVLQFLKLAGASGRLELERLGERIEIGFDRGRPTDARCSGRSVRLGDVLVHRGVVSEATLAQALAEQRAGSGARLGAVLRASHGVRDDDVASAVGEVFRRLVCALALWPEGRFHFRPGADAEADDVLLDVELDRLLIEGLHRADLTTTAS